MKWLEALKKWNEKRGTWCIPKKGTLEHAEVTKLMGRPSAVGKVKQMKEELEAKVKQQIKDEDKAKKAKVVKKKKTTMEMKI
jgi:hypothetical protein